MIGKTIQSVRKSQGQTQGNLAAAAGISGPYLSQVEKGRKSPTLETLTAIAVALKTPLEILFFISYQETDKVSGPMVEHLQTLTARVYGLPEEAGRDV